MKSESRNYGNALNRRTRSLLILLWLIVAGPLIRATLSPNPSLPVPLQHTIDPNVAPWWELAALPEIGEGMAREIVAFREAACADGAKQAFESASDLDQVRGIGPKTLIRLAPHFRFEGRCQGPADRASTASVQAP